MRRASSFLSAVLVLAVSIVHAGEASPRVVLVVIDGLGAGRATPERLPALAQRARTVGGLWATATGVLPARTNPNHASLLTGYWPSGHGIVGNTFWDERLHRRRPMDAPELLDAETMFEAIERQAPALRTAAVFGKAKLRRLFGPGPKARGPDVLWTNGAEYASDPVVIEATRTLLEQDPPDFLAVSIADVDRASHAAGPSSGDAMRAIEQADRLVADLVGVLAARPEWPRTLVVVTGDHGFESVDPDRSIVLPRSPDGGVTWVPEGTVAWAYRASTSAASDLDAALQSAGQIDGVVGVRTDLDALDLTHARAGAALAIAAPGRAFWSGLVPAPFRGDHGGEREQRVPFLVFGGLDGVQRVGEELEIHLPDFAPTAARRLGIEAPATRGRRAEPPLRQGRVLPWVDGQTPQQSK